MKSMSKKLKDKSRLVEMTLFIAHKKINQFMKAVDLCYDQKVFVSDKQTVTYRTTSHISDSYIRRIIEMSRTEKDYWIPAIQFGDKLFVATDIKEISSGDKTMFVHSRKGLRDER